jgi:hypothetical protein
MPGESLVPVGRRPVQQHVDEIVDPGRTRIELSRVSVSHFWGTPAWARKFDTDDTCVRRTAAMTRTT